MRNMTKRRYWSYVLVAVALVMVMGLAACGGDDENGDEDPEVAPVETDAAPAEDEAPPAGEDEVTPAEGEATPAEGGGEDTAMGDAANGQQVFANTGCVDCHAVDTDEILTGPSLMGVANVAGTRVEGMSAQDYLRQSLVAPDEHVVEGFDAGIMPSYADQLDDQQISDVVAYLMTLTG